MKIIYEYEKKDVVAGKLWYYPTFGEVLLTYADNESDCLGDKCEFITRRFGLITRRNSFVLLRPTIKEDFLSTVRILGITHEIPG